MGEGQGGDEEGEAEVARGRPTGGREVQPGGPRLLAKHHVGRTAPPVEENWDNKEVAEVEEMGGMEEQAEE